MDSKGVRTLNELRNALLDPRGSSTSTICAHRPYGLQQPLRPLNHITLIPQLIQQHILLFQQRRVFQQAQNLSEERNRLLVQLLRVSNIRRNDLVERQTRIPLRKLRPVLLRSDGKFASHRIFGLFHMRIYIVDVQAAESRRHG